jgi:hypothetical protein
MPLSAEIMSFHFRRCDTFTLYADAAAAAAFHAADAAIIAARTDTPA